MEQKKEELRRRAFELIAPIAFSNSVTEDLLGILNRLRAKEDLHKLEQILKDKETQHTFFFGDRKCLPVEDFERMARKQLASYSYASLQNIPLGDFFIALEHQIDNQRLDFVSTELQNKEYLLWKSLKPWKCDCKNTASFRRLLSAFVVYGKFFTDMVSIEDLLNHLEQKQIKL